MDTHNFNLKNSLPGRVSKSVKHLLNEFKNIYEEKLKRLEGEIQSGSQEESLRMKVRILHSYVNDLSDQNQVLVQTVEELEKEATKKVAILEVKLRAADKTIHVTGLTSQRVPLERITDHSAYRAQSSQKPGDLMKAQVEDLRNQLKAKNGIIQSLREEIKTLLFHSAQKKNELLEKKEAMLLLPKPEFEAAQITSGDVIGDRHTKLGLSHQDAAASVGEGREAVEVMAEVESPKEKRAHKLCKQSLKRERIVGRVLNSQRQNKVEVSKLTSQIEHLQLHQGKAKNSSTHSMSQDPHKQELCGLDNSGPCEADRAVLWDPSAGLQWNFSRQQERYKQLCLKHEQSCSEESIIAPHPTCQSHRLAPSREGAGRAPEQLGITTCII